MRKKPLGRLLPEQIKLLEAPRADPALIEGFKALGPAASWISDALDELGLVGSVSASTLRPTITGAIIVGPALTMRNISLGGSPTEQARAGANGMAEIEAHNLAQPGDVLVVDGIDGCSNLGGVSATIAQRQGTIGAVVHGGIRDLPHSREIGFPVWSSAVTPMTGKYRLLTVEVNGVVDIAGVRVEPGDIVYADDDGICFMPHDKAAAILELCRKKKAAEEKRLAAIRSGVSIAELAGGRK